MLGDPEEDDRRDSQLGDLGDSLAEPVERELVLARHRRHFAPEVFPVVDEQRIDQVADRQAVSLDELAEPGVAAQASGAMKRITGSGLERHASIPEMEKGRVDAG